MGKVCEAGLHSKYTGTTSTSLNNITNPTIDKDNNRFNENQGYEYDKNGNLVESPVDQNVVRTVVFDGDNKQKYVVENGSNVGEYFYDGEGKRVKKKVYESNGVDVKEETVFVYSGSKLVAEFSTKPVATNPTTSYTATDQLGSPRVITDSKGDVISRRDFMPFGEEIINNTGERQSANTSGIQAPVTDLKYNAPDSLRQKFTGYQKDDETSLDFAEARMYENRHGRFTAVDPLLASGKSANPQTFNRYVYVGNNPINVIDPLGLDWYYDGKNSYQWFKNKPTEEGWSPVKFDSAGRYYVENMCRSAECDETTLGVLFQGGGWTFASMLPFTDVVNQTTFDLGFGALTGGGNFFRRIGNSPIETNFLGSPFDAPVEIPGFYSGTVPLGLSLEKLGVSPFFEYGEYENNTQRGAGVVTEITTGLLITKAASSLNALRPSGLGDLTIGEVKQIQNIVDEAGRPLEVIGSAAKAERRGWRTRLPFSKEWGKTISDIDYTAPPGSLPYFESTGLHQKLPSIDSHGIVPGTHNIFMGPGIKFSPETRPIFIPRAQ